MSVKSIEPESKADIVTTHGQEIELINEDAELLFERCELVSFASDRVLDNPQQQFGAFHWRESRASRAKSPAILLKHLRPGQTLRRPRFNQTSTG
jgi:hypothetical protein